MDTVRIGVIGLKFGQHLVRTLANMPDATLVAVADRNPSLPGGLAAFATHYGARAYDDGMAMIAQESLDALCLCTAPRGREPLISQAVAKGIALFVEKPWATNLAEAQRLATLCRDQNARVMVGFSFRFHPALVKLRELLAGELGPGRLLNGEYLFNWQPPAGHWLWDPANGNGFFNENSCHLFDAVCALLGEPVAVTAEAINPLGAPSEHAAAVTLRFADGAVAALTIGGIGVGAFRTSPRIDIVTANGQAHLSGREHIWEQLSWATRDSAVIQQITRPPEALGRTRYTDALTHFLDVVRGSQPPAATVEDGVRSVALAMAVYESARTGRKVTLPQR